MNEVFEVYELGAGFEMTEGFTMNERVDMNAGVVMDNKLRWTMYIQNREIKNTPYMYC